MEHTKTITEKASARPFCKEQGEGSLLSTNCSADCSYDSVGSSHSYQGVQPACFIYHQDVGQPTRDRSPHLAKAQAYAAINTQQQQDALTQPSSPPHTPASQPGQQRRAGARASGNGSSSFFFARVPPTITHQQLLDLFSKYGAVEDLNLFRPFAEAKTSKGCGIARFSSAETAATAKSMLHGKHKWTDEAPPMVVEWVNEDKMRSTCCKAGSNEIVFEPKSRSVRAKQQSHNGSVYSSKASSVSSGSSTQQMGELTLASSLASNNAHAMDAGCSLGYDQVRQRQGGGSQPAPPPMSLQHHQMKQQQMMWQLQQPPPPPRQGYGSSSMQQQLQQGGAAAAVGAASARQGMLAVALRSQQHHNCRLNSEPLPNLPAAKAAAAAAAQQQQQQQQHDIVQAVMQAAPNNATQFAAQQQQQQQQQAYMPILGFAQQQQLQLQQCHDQAMAMVGVLDSVSQQQLMMQPGSLRAGLSGSSLMGASFTSGLQQGRSMPSSDVSLSSHLLNAAAARRATADGALEYYNSYNSYDGLLMQGRGSMPSSNGSVLHQQAYDGLPLAAAAAGITPVAAAGARIPWRSVSLSMDGANQTAAANAAAAATAAAASGLSRSGYANAAESQQQQLQRQMMFDGCNMLSGGNMSLTGPVLGSCLPNGPGNFSLPPPPLQQQQLSPHDAEQWLSGCAFGAYLHLQSSGSQGSGSCHAAVNTDMQVQVDYAGASAARQQSATMSADGELPNLRALSDPCIMRVEGYAAHDAAQPQQMQQGTAPRRIAAAPYQQQQLGVWAGRSASSALPGSALGASPSTNDAMAAVMAVMSGALAAADAVAADDHSAINQLSTGVGVGAITGPAAAAAAAGVGNDGDRLSVAVASGTAAVQALALHLDSITNLSGAQVQICSDRGTVMMWLHGSREQVQMASNIINLLLSQQLQQ